MIIIGVFTILGVSYALFSETLTGEKQYSIKSNGLKIYLDESNQSESITIANAIPVTDDDGMKNEPYNFSLVNEETQDLEYTIYLKEEEYTNKTPSSAIKYYYTRDVGKLKKIQNMTSSQTEDGRYYLETGIIPSKNTYHYTFRMWIDYKAGNEILNTEYSIRLEVVTKQTIDLYKEDILKGCDPVLSDNLVPVTIESDGTVKKASLFQEWYNYSKKNWANAVVLEETAEQYVAGDIINPDYIESYFVWIPRYKYKIFNDGNYTGSTSLNPNAPQTIEVEFESKDTTPSNGTTKNEWLSHPAFQAFDTNGLWVGKFEAGYRDAGSNAAAQVSTGDASMLVVKPNIYSWRNMNIGNMFKTSYDYLRSDESHMMKNTEWGAVAYLSHSIYGKNGEVYINNNSSFLTGCGGDSASADGTSTCLNAFGSKINGIYNQTTTGNISGVFDMSGGAWEYVMGYSTSASTVGRSSGITSLYADFFTNSEWDKYYDKYTSSSNTAYNNRILGDATGEMGPFANEQSSWYNDRSHFVDAANPWFHRGGGCTNTSDGGVFVFYVNAGGGVASYSFRVVLAP